MARWTNELVGIQLFKLQVELNAPIHTNCTHAEIAYDEISAIQARVAPLPKIRNMYVKNKVTYIRWRVLSLAPRSNMASGCILASLQNSRRGC
jgi:hypothetical protein